MIFDSSFGFIFSHCMFLLFSTAALTMPATCAFGTRDATCARSARACCMRLTLICRYDLFHIEIRPRPSASDSLVCMLSERMRHARYVCRAFVGVATRDATRDTSRHERARSLEYAVRGRGRSFEQRDLVVERCGCAAMHQTRRAVGATFHCCLVSWFCKVMLTLCCRVGRMWLAMC